MPFSLILYTQYFFVSCIPSASYTILTCLYIYLSSPHLIVYTTLHLQASIIVVAVHVSHLCKPKVQYLCGSLLFSSIIEHLTYSYIWYCCLRIDVIVYCSVVRTTTHARWYLLVSDPYHPSSLFSVEYNQICTIFYCVKWLIHPRIIR